MSRVFYGKENANLAAQVWNSKGKKEEKGTNYQRRQTLSVLLVIYSMA